MIQSEPIKFGFVGLGWPGEQHAKAVIALPGASVAAACDLNAERLQKFAATFDAPKQFTDYAEMLADPEITAVVVSLPNFLHYSASIAALQAGKHVLCEKPPTMNVAEIEAIRDEANKRGLTYFFGRQSRFSPKLMAAKKIVDAGGLGKLYFAKAERIRSRGIPGGIDGWFVQKAKSGGGVVIDIGVHALDAAWYLMGCPRPVAVSAQVSAHFRDTLPADSKFDVEDTGFAFIRFEGGLVMHLEATWAANVTEAIPKSGGVGHELENTTIFGERATLSLNPATLYTMDGKERVDTPLEVVEGIPPFVAQMSDFIEAVRTGNVPTNSVEQAVSLMKMLMAIYDSSATGAEVRLT